jgi:hypothetical protein
MIGFLIGRTKLQGASGFIWGCLLGPVGWVIVLCLPHGGPPCQECLAPLNPLATRCRHCGAVRVKKVSVVCPACGEKLMGDEDIAKGRIICPTCQREFTPEITKAPFF